MSPKPSILIVGLPLDPSKPPMKMPWSDEPVSIVDELNKLEAKMREKGYDEGHYAVARCVPRSAAYEGADPLVCGRAISRKTSSLA